MIESLRTMQAWLPLLGYARRFSAASDTSERAAVVADGLEWAASRTASRLDDRLATRIAAVLQTPQGVALVDEALAIIDSLPQEQNP